VKTLIFDTETSDLIGNSLLPIDKLPRIIELFGLSLDENCEEVGAYHFLFDPGIKITEEITRITSITNEMVKGKPRFSESSEAIRDLIMDHEEVVAHNLSFDRQMVDIEMKRCGLEVDWPILICTVEQSEFYRGHRLNLQALHELLFGEGFPNAHRAENDVRALARCFIKMRQDGDI